LLTAQTNGSHSKYYIVHFLLLHSYFRLSECRTSNREVAGSNLILGYCVPKPTQRAIPQWAPAKSGE